MRPADGRTYWKLPDYVTGKSHFSADGERRYWLTRTWAESGALCVFVGLNPSMADERGEDELGDDPTVRYCWRRAEHWGFGRFAMLNLFAYRDVSPERMWQVDRDDADLIGENDDHLRRWAREARAVGRQARARRRREGDRRRGVLPAAYESRASRVTALLSSYGNVFCLRKVGAQQAYPRHPRGCPRDTTPIVWA